MTCLSLYLRVFVLSTDMFPYLTHVSSLKKGTQTLETDEELMEEGGKAETPRLNNIPRAGAKKTYSKVENACMVI